MKIHVFYERALRRTLGAWRRRPFPGPFARIVLNQLRDEALFPGTGLQPFRVHIDSVERGNGPFFENFNIKFRLADNLPDWSPDSIEMSDKPLGVTEQVTSVGHTGGRRVVLEPALFFQFNAASGVAGNIRRFRSFATNHLSRLAEQQGHSAFVKKFVDQAGHLAAATADLPKNNDIV